MSFQTHMTDFFSVENKQKHLFGGGGLLCFVYKAEVKSNVVYDIGQK